MNLLAIRLIGFLFLFMSCASLAQSIPMDTETSELINNLILNRDGQSSLVVAMGLITLTAQFLKWKALKPLYIWLNKTLGKKVEVIAKQLVVALLGYAYTVIYLIEDGKGEAEAIVTVLTSGGAITIYNVVKSIWRKRDE